MHDDEVQLAMWRQCFMDHQATVGGWHDDRGGGVEGHEGDHYPGREPLATPDSRDITSNRYRARKGSTLFVSGTR